MKKVAISIILILAWAILTATARADYDWPQFRGPNRDGVSLEKGLLQEWPKDGPTRLWELKGIGQGDGSPVTKDGRLFIQGTRENDSLLICVDIPSGKRLWDVRLDRKFLNGNNPGPSSTPTIDGDRIYALTGYGTLVCARLADGGTIWSLSLPRDLKGACGSWGYAESPLVEGNLLIVSPGARQGTIMALDKMTGKVVWATKGLSEACGYASTIAADVDSMRVIIGFTSQAGVGVNAADGALLWRYKHPANRTANNAAPIFHGNKVFYSSDYGTGGGLLELAPINGRILTREVYFNKNMKNHYGGVVLVNGHLYGASSNILTCMDFETGKAVWRDRSIGKVAVTYADSRLYLLSDGGGVGLVDASPEAYRLQGTFNLESPDAMLRTAPVISNGRLYLRNGTRLECYDIRK